MDGKQILDLAMGQNDADAATVREYLKALLSRLWSEGESFSGKRPFGNSGWDYELFAALIKGGAVAGELEEDRFPSDFDEDAASTLIFEAIDAL